VPEYGRSPPNDVYNWEFPIIDIYWEENGSDEFDDPDLLVEAYYLSKGANILETIGRILFEEDEVFKTSWSFFYPIPYLTSLIWEKYQLSLDLQRQGHEWGLSPQQYDFALFMLDELQKNNEDLERYLPPYEDFMLGPPPPIIQWSYGDFVSLLDAANEDPEPEEEIPFADYNDYRLESIERRYNEVLASPYGDLLGEIGPRRIEDEEPPPGYIWVIDGNGKAFLYDTRFGRGAPQA
jgi:hypothetical protein